MRCYGFRRAIALLLTEKGYVRELHVTELYKLFFFLSYDKNAMLVFNANADFVHASDLIPERVSAILETFTKFRFEIETHMDLRNAAIVEKCDECKYIHHNY